MTELRSIFDELLTATHASRVTLRRDDPGDYALVSALIPLDVFERV